MNLFLLMSLQAAAAAPPAAAPRPEGVDFDLARYRSSGGPAGVDALFACDRPQGSEIVVCGRRKPAPYPLEEMAKIFEPKPLRAETGIGGGATADIHTEAVRFPNGLVSNRIMLRIKLPF